MTTRDDVWSVALDTLASDGAFKRTDLDFPPAKRNTVRRTLREMETHDWLVRTSKHSPIWRAGPMAKQRLRPTVDTYADVETEE